MRLTLKQLIDANTVTHEMLAIRIGVHPSALSFWYHGKRNITARNADKIAKALGVRAVVHSGTIQYERIKER